jgi:NAD(P)-dependent dehydrogenase (short-subunit alcohol dehydrogenase family)
MNSEKETAMITGASSGIGLGLTKGFLAAGFNVVANSRQITAAGTLIPSDDLLLVDGDVGEPSTARQLIHHAEQRFGGSMCSSTTRASSRRSRLWNTPRRTSSA